MVRSNLDRLQFESFRLRLVLVPLHCPHKYHAEGLLTFAK